MLTEILSYQNLFVVSPMVRSINYSWVLPTLSIRVKGKRFTFECWNVSRFSVRWSSSSTILTLMAWRSNILQKSIVRDCSSLLKNDLRFTRRWQSLQLAVACCAFCALFMCYQKCLNFAVLKVFPSGFEWCSQSLLLRQRLEFVEVHQIGPFVTLLSDLLIDAFSRLLLK